MKLDVVLDTHIRYNIDEIRPDDAQFEILNALTFSNPQKKIAEKEMLWNAKNLPDKIGLWEWAGPAINENIILPRGFLSEFEEILKNYNIDVKYIDNRSKSEDKIFDNDVITLRDYQLKAVDKLAFTGSGIYSAATGSGKTRVMLALAKACQQKTIVICEKTDIAVQWLKTAKDFGFNVSSIFGGEYFGGSDLIIALRQGLLALNFDNRWFEKFGTVIIDECHHQSSETMFNLVQKFPAYYRFGCSATPDKDSDTWPITRAVLGPIVHSTPTKEVGEHLIIPSVRVIKTDFEFDYRPTFVGKGGKIFRNNYNAMMKDLECDWERNHLIAKLSAELGMINHSVLVFSKRKKHLKILKLYIEDYIRYFSNKGFPCNIYILTGDNSKEYDKIKRDLDKQKGIILLSTLANEGTDIPCLDRLFLAYPGRKLRGYEQAIGRIMRSYHNKKDAIVYDFRDYKIPILNSQFRNRAQGIYHKNGYEIIDG